MMGRTLPLTSQAPTSRTVRPRTSSAVSTPFSKTPMMDGCMCVMGLPFRQKGRTPGTGPGSLPFCDRGWVLLDGENLQRVGGARGSADAPEAVPAGLAGRQVGAGTGTRDHRLVDDGHADPV